MDPYKIGKNLARVSQLACNLLAAVMFGQGIYLIVWGEYLSMGIFNLAIASMLVLLLSQDRV